MFFYHCKAKIHRRAGAIVLEFFYPRCYKGLKHCLESKQLGVLAPPEVARRDFLGANFSAKLLFSTKNNTSNGTRGAKMIFPSGRGASFKMN